MRCSTLRLVQPHATLLRGPRLRLSAAACRTLSRPPCGAPSAAPRSARVQPHAALLAQPRRPSPAPGYAAACRTPARPHTAPLRSPTEPPCSVTQRVLAQPPAAPPVQPMRPSPAPHAEPLLSHAQRPGPGEAPCCAPAKPHTATLRSRCTPAQSQATPLRSGPAPHPCAVPRCAHAHMRFAISKPKFGLCRIECICVCTDCPLSCLLYFVCRWGMLSDCPVGWCLDRASPVERVLGGNRPAGQKPGNRLS